MISWRLTTAACAVAICVPGAALAAGSHSVDITIRDAIVSRSGQTGVSVGLISGPPFAGGAVIQRVTVASQSGAMVTTNSRWTIFTRAGTITGVGSSTRTTNPDGSTTVIGTRTIRGGTGAYRGVHGRLRVTGTASTSGITTSHWTGTIRY